MTTHIAIILADNCVGSAVLALAELFATANRIHCRVNATAHPLFRTQLASHDGAPVRCSSGHSLAAELSLDAIPATAILYLPAFAVGTEAEAHTILREKKALCDWLRDKANRHPLVAGHCSGSLLLAQAGLLDNQRATCTWWLAPMLRQGYPRIQLAPDEMVVRSEKLLTGGGSSAYQDVALLLVEQFGGRHIARLTAKYLLIDNQRQHQSPYAVPVQPDHSDALVSEAQRWIRSNLHRDFRLGELANVMAVSTRTLTRHFRQALQVGPQAYIQRQRIEKSKVLLETTTLPLQEVLSRCGYRDESAFRRQFARHCQLSPGEYRRRFAGVAGQNPPTSLQIPEKSLIEN